MIRKIFEIVCISQFMKYVFFLMILLDLSLFVCYADEVIKLTLQLMRSYDICKKFTALYNFSFLFINIQKYIMFLL